MGYFSKKTRMFVEKLQDKFAASDALIAGAAVYIMAGGVPMENGLGIEPLRVPTRHERIRTLSGLEEKSLFDFCRMYKKMYPGKRDYELDFYEELKC